MLKHLVATALSRRVIVVLGLLVLLAVGFWALSNINIEAYPNPAPVILEITAQAPGLSAEEMERYYTIPMEVGVASVPGVDIIRSTSFYGLSFVRVRFNYGVDYYFARTQTAIALQQNVNLPNNVQPTIQGSSLVGEVFRYQLVGPSHFGLSQLRSIQDWVMQRRLLSVPGVVQVVTWGGTTKTYSVEIDLHNLDRFNLTLQQVLTAIGNANVNVGGRTINVGQQSVNVRGLGLIHDEEDIKKIVVGTLANGLPVTVKDVAKDADGVRVGYLPRLGKAGRDDDDDVVTAIVVMNRTLQTKEVLARVKAEVEKINADGTLPPGVRVVPFYDRGELVGVTMRTVLHNLAFGCALVFLVQWIFLGNLRSAIIVGANIPFALLFSVAILYLTGESANLLSVGAVDFGIIVDSCVILIENIFRNLQADEGAQRQLLIDYPAPAGARSWTDRVRMILASSIQVNKPIYYSTLITLAAFIPLFTMQGVEGQIFGPMARTYAYALSGALIATYTVSPVLASFLLPMKVGHSETLLVRALRRLYEPVLRWSLAHRFIVIGIGLLFLIGAVLLVPLLGGEFMPTLEEGNLWIRATMPQTISLESAMPYVTRIRKILRDRPEVITVVSQHGRPDDGSDAAGYYNAEFFAPLKPEKEWPKGATKEKLIKELQSQFSEEFKGINFNFSQYIQDNIEEGLSGVKGENSIKIIGPDLATLERIAAQIREVVAPVRGITDLDIFRVLGQPNLNIAVDRDKAARYGLNTGDVNAVIQAALGGTQATTVYEGDRQFALIVRLAPGQRDFLEQIGKTKIGVANPSGPTAYIPLEEIAEISLDTGASYIYHERNQRFIPIKFSVRERDLEGAVAEAQERIARSVKLPVGYRIEWSGEFEELQHAKKRLTVIVPVTLAIIMFLLYAPFGSVRDTLLPLVGIPFAFAGGVIALKITGLHFSISAAIGFVSLMGISVMNGILLLTYYHEIMQAGGLKGIDGMYRAASQWMRPMLMTALSACIGLFPAAMSTSIGSQVQRPLATVVVGGLLIGPLVLLVVVPPLCLTFLSKRE